MNWVVFTIPFRVLGGLWPRGGCGCLAWIVLGFMLIGAFA
jgi:hypothetical protein